MFILIIAIIILLAVLSAFYYNKFIWRLIAYFFDEKGKRAKKIVWTLSSVMAVMTFNMFSVAGIFLLHFLAISLIVDFVAVFFKKKHEFVRIIINFGTIPLLISALIFGYGYANINNILRKSYEIQSKELSADYRILLISDIHYGTIIDSDDLKGLKKRLDGEMADIVVLGGDILDESTTKPEMERIMEVLGTVSSKYGVYYISGNHDFQSYSSKKDYTDSELRSTLSKNGICFLKDETKEINGEIILAGRDDKSPERKDIGEILKGEDKNKFIITLDHQPVEYEEAENSGTDLIISGHTHAGQIFPAGYLIKLLGTAELWYGHEKYGNMDAIVSSGAAGWGFPIRTQKNSEYVVIDIKGVKK
ncbi:MAG: hypothetical protein E7415_05240 [Ruminococcaceae bacterium]|nr:hypothetical protein [Oscillospiraceae bacterium]